MQPRVSPGYIRPLVNSMGRRGVRESRSGGEGEIIHSFHKEISLEFLIYRVIESVGITDFSKNIIFRIQSTSGNKTEHDLTDTTHLSRI